MRLADGAQVNPGDRLIDLHMDNYELVGGPPGSAAFSLMQPFRRELATLWFAGPSDPSRIPTAVHAITLLAPAGRRLGFEMRPLPISPGSGR
ncbi:MAG TPA: hypothetical protein VMU49_02040 [Candidatus Acidoferrales bacterium]|nr:hypothetical protein [Candidatus Acidoferrales bacterium]